MSATRRTVLLKGFGATTAAWLAANWPDQVAQAQTAQSMGHFTFFTRPQAMEIDAMSQQIYPSDSTPGGSFILMSKSMMSGIPSESGRSHSERRAPRATASA